MHKQDKSQVMQIADYYPAWIIKYTVEKEREMSKHAFETAEQKELRVPN